MEGQPFSALRLERVGPVLRVTIDNPASELNTVDARLHHELVTLFAALRDEREARAVVLTGSGRAFSAGGDFDWFPELRDVARLDALRHDARQLITGRVDRPAL
jgi:enoyl-CoA hydratase